MLYTSRFSSVTKLVIIFLIFAFSIAVVVANTDNNYVGPTAAPPGGQPTIACGEGQVLKSIRGSDRCVTVSDSDTVPSNTCGANQFLRWTASGFQCTEPTSEALLPKCASGQFLKRKTVNNNAVWGCEEVVDEQLTVPPCDDGVLIRGSDGGLDCKTYADLFPGSATWCSGTRQYLRRIRYDEDAVGGAGAFVPTCESLPRSAQNIRTCGEEQVSRWDGTQWQCVDVNAGLTSYNESSLCVQAGGSYNSEHNLCVFDRSVSSKRIKNSSHPDVHGTLRSAICPTNWEAVTDENGNNFITNNETRCRPAINGCVVDAKTNLGFAPNSCTERDGHTCTAALNKIGCRSTRNTAVQICNNVNQVLRWDGSSFECAEITDSDTKPGDECGDRQILTWDGDNFSCIEVTDEHLELPGCSRGVLVQDGDELGCKNYTELLPSKTCSSNPEQYLYSIGYDPAAADGAGAIVSRCRSLPVSGTTIHAVSSGGTATTDSALLEAACLAHGGDPNHGRTTIGDNDGQGNIDVSNTCFFGDFYYNKHCPVGWTYVGRSRFSEAYCRVNISEVDSLLIPQCGSNFVLKWNGTRFVCSAQGIGFRIKHTSSIDCTNAGGTYDSTHKLCVFDAPTNYQGQVSTSATCPQRTFNQFEGEDDIVWREAIKPDALTRTVQYFIANEAKTCPTEENAEDSCTIPARTTPEFASRTCTYGDGQRCYVTLTKIGCEAYKRLSKIGHGSLTLPECSEPGRALQWNNITRGFQCTDVVSTERPIPDCTGKDQALQWDGQQFGCRTIQSQLELLWESETAVLVTEDDAGRKFSLNDSISNYKSIKIVQRHASTPSGTVLGYYSHEIPVSSIPTERDTNVRIGNDEHGGTYGDDGAMNIWSPTSKTIRLERYLSHQTANYIYQIWGIREGKIKSTRSIADSCVADGGEYNLLLNLCEFDQQSRCELGGGTYNADEEICFISSKNYGWDFSGDTACPGIGSRNSNSFWSDDATGATEYGWTTYRRGEDNAKFALYEKKTCGDEARNIDNGGSMCTTGRTSRMAFSAWPSCTYNRVRIGLSPPHLTYPRNCRARVTRIGCVPR